MIYKSYVFEEQIKEIKKNFFLFYGENLGLKNEFKNLIRQDHNKSEIFKFSQEEVLKNQDIFFNEILNISLFEKKKIFFIDNCTDKIFDIIQNIKKKVDTQKIYLFAEILDKRSKLRNYFEKEKDYITVACYPDNEITIKKIINNKLKGFIGLNPENINMITDACSLDRNKLKEQLDKTISYFRDKKINNDKLEDILGIKENVDFNYLKDEALNGNKINTNKLLSETILESEKNIYYLALINQRLNKLHEIYKLSNGGNIENSINMLKPPIFWKEKPMFLLQAKKWNLNKIKRVLNKTYKLEIEIKSNPYVNKDLLIKKLIVDMCQLANSS